MAKRMASQSDKLSNSEVLSKPLGDFCKFKRACLIIALKRCSREILSRTLNDLDKHVFYILHILDLYVLYFSVNKLHRCDYKRMKKSKYVLVVSLD